MKSKFAAAVALLIACVSLLAATSSTASAGTAPLAGRASAPTALAPTAPAPTPLAGHYSGTDNQGNHIRFNYRNGRIENFRINHLDIGGATVSHARWSTSCTDAYHCSWGAWTSAHGVEGAWNSGTHGGTARHFQAHWVSSHVSQGVSRGA